MILGNPITLGGGDIDWDDYIDGNLPAGSLTLDTNRSINAYTFSGNKELTNVTLLNAAGIGDYAFRDCTKLTTFYAPNATSVGNGAFGYSTYGAYNNKLRNVSLPKATWIGARAFVNCHYLKGDLFFPRVTGCGEACFMDISTRWISGSAPFGRTITLPKLNVPTSQSTLNIFRNAGADAFDLGADVKAIGHYWFYTSGPGISALLYPIVILRSNELVVAKASTSIASISASTKIYVPQNLIESYKTATNWSAKGDIFYAIEGSEYEHYYANGVGVFQSISKVLSNCALSNDSVDVSYGEPYTAQLTADSGYSLNSVEVTMDGEDITANVYDSATGTISISTVTGEITITASAN